MPDADGELIPLTELGIITRYSLAVRKGQVDRAELVEVLRADLDFLTGSRSPAKTPARSGAKTAPTAAAKAAPAKKATRRPAD